MEPIELADGDLTLRPWRPADADAVYRACQDPDIQRWTTVPSPYRLEDARQFVSDAPRKWESGDRMPFGAFDAATGDLLGAAALIRVSEAVAALGYWTAPWARGRAVAERSARLIGRWALGPLGVRRLEWEAIVGNHASRMVAARLGMTMEGTHRAAARTREADMWMGALLAGELREAADDDARLARAARQARTFGAPQPRIPADGLLRPLTDADAPDIVESCHDPEMIRYTSVPDPYRREDVERFLRDAAGGWLAGTVACFAVEADGHFSGIFDLRLDTWPARIAEVGYSVAPWARGRGVASTALRTLCDWAFAALALDRIEWHALIGNAGSRRVAEKAGFVVEGTEHRRLLQRGHPVDTWYGALLRDAAPA
jgi:RimJ/RimL family protein N-acetyltransferase